MRNPFDVLGVEISANDATIKKAYLAKVRAYPPDHAPTEFQSIRAAYEAIKTEKARLAHELFHVTSPDMTSLWHDLIGDAPPLRPDSTLFKRMLGESVKQYRLPADRSRWRR